MTLPGCPAGTVGSLTRKHSLPGVCPGRVHELDVDRAQGERVAAAMEHEVARRDAR